MWMREYDKCKCSVLITGLSYVYINFLEIICFHFVYEISKRKQRIIIVKIFIE